MKDVFCPVLKFRDENQTSVKIEGRKLDFFRRVIGFQLSRARLGTRERRQMQPSMDQRCRPRPVFFRLGSATPCIRGRVAGLQGATDRPVIYGATQSGHVIATRDRSPFTAPGSAASVQCRPYDFEGPLANLSCDGPCRS